MEHSLLKRPTTTYTRKYQPAHSFSLLGTHPSASRMASMLRRSGPHPAPQPLSPMCDPWETFSNNQKTKAVIYTHQTAFIIADRAQTVSKMSLSSLWCGAVCELCSANRTAVSQRQVSLQDLGVHVSKVCHARGVECDCGSAFSHLRSPPGTARNCSFANVSIPVIHISDDISRCRIIRWEIRNWLHRWNAPPSIRSNSATCGGLE